MSSKPRVLSSSNRNSRLRLSLPWTVILGLIFCITLLLLVGAGPLLNPILLLGTVSVGLFLYQRYPAFYVGFTWWVIFLVSFVRRVIDYQSGYVNPGTWSLASMLVASISVITLVRHSSKLLTPGGLPFFLCIASVGYGILITLFHSSLTLKIITISLSWLSSILFSFHLFVNWRQYPEYRQSIQRTFLWGVLVMGIYGVWQYLVAPGWDRFYIEQLEVLSFGIPQPFGIRVFSTMGSPQAFAATMMAGLLLLFSEQSKLRFPIAGVGYLAFLLSLARSGWLSWGIGLLIFFGFVKPRLRTRLILSVLLTALFVIPLTTIEPFSSVISDRFDSLSAPQEDFSYQERVAGFNQLVDAAFAELFGRGLLASGGKVNTFVLGDNGFLSLLFPLGWFGTIPYLVGLLTLLLKLFQAPKGRADPFLGVARAITLGTFSQICLKTVTDGEIGMVLWGFLGISMAAHRYYFYQIAIEKKRWADATQ